MSSISIRKTLIASNIALSLGVPCAQAALVTNLYGPNNWSTDSANFTMLAANGGVVGGTNDVSMLWDGDAFTASSDYTGPGSYANVTASSTAAFFGHAWAAHDIQVFVPGSYSFDVTLGGGNPESGFLTATVGAGQLGMHMLFDWGGNNNIDVFVVASPSSIFGSGIAYSLSSVNSKCSANYTGSITKNCLYGGPLYGSAGAPAGNTVWALASVDGNGDGVMGIPMAAGGPFPGFNANFNANLTAVPVPAAVWLFGSGLMCLVAAARRQKRA